MLEIYTYSVLITAIFFTSFGLFAFIKNPREHATQLFAFLSFGFAIWSYAWFALLLTTGNEAQAVFYAKLLNAGATLIPIAFFHWVLVVLKQEERHKVFIWAAYLITFIFLALSGTDWYIEGVRQASFFPFWPVPGPGYLLFVLFGYILLVGYSSIKLLIRFYNTHSVERYQVGYILLGAVLGFGGSATIFPIMYGLDTLQPIGVFTLMLSPFVLGHAALKYNLMNIKVFATQMFAGVLTLVFIINLALSLQEGAASIFFSSLLLIFVIIFSILLIRSVQQEIKSRLEIERLAKDLKVANERLKELDKLKSQFLSIASHDLRAPLTAIRNFMSILLDGTYGRLPPAAEEGTQQVFDRATEMADMVDNYLDVSRIEQGRMKYDFAEIDFAVTVNEAVDAFSPIAKGKGLELNYKETKDSLPMKADEPKLREVVENLINNAIVYTEKGSVTITLEKSGDKAKLIISDTGVGMSKATIGKLFKLFSQGDDSRKINPKSTGVGLYITKAHVEAHKGRIWAESEGSGRGSRFVVEIPLSQAKPQ